MFKPKIFGKYLLLERIGFGGIGEVYKAKTFAEGGYSKLVAVKTIRAVFSDEEEVIELFKNEATLSLSLDHPNIVKVFDYGKIKDKHYLAMEYIHGKDLRSIIKRARELNLSFPLPYSIKSIAEVCQGLDYIHHKKDPRTKKETIVHRDISPSNILISFQGEVKIIDFGVAKAAKESDEFGKKEEFFMGKLKYASPEQIGLKNIDQRSDIFATGILLYELITNQNPFEGETEVETVRHIKHAEYQFPSLINPDIPKKIEKIIETTLAKDPTNRYQTSRELLGDLTRYMRDHDIAISKKEFATYLAKLFAESDTEALPVEPEVGESTIITDTIKLKVKETPDKQVAVEKSVTISEKVEKEKKNVAVLCFEVSDIKTSKTEDEIGPIMNEIFKRAVDLVYKYDGKIDKIVEKKLVAIFGIPEMHENDPERAILAGFNLLESLKDFSKELKIQTDLKTVVDYGNILVNYKASDINSYTVSGDAVEHALNILPQAPQNTLVATEAISGVHIDYEFEKISEIEFKEKTKSIFRIKEKEKKEETPVTKRAYATSFVGRAKEKNNLKKLNNNVKEGQGQIISIRGDVGTGKTRLAHEFLIDVAQEDQWLLEAAATPVLEKYEESKLAYSIVIDLIKKLTHISDDDSEALVKQKLFALERFNLVKRDIALLAKILNIDIPDPYISFLDGQKLKQEIFLSLKKLFFNMATETPLLLLLEDFHWIDEASLEFFEFFLSQITTAKILIILIHRTDLQASWTDLPNYSESILEPLNKKYTKTIANQLLGKLSKSNKISNLVLEKSEGNPLFLEEIVKSIKELETKDIKTLEQKISDLEINIPQTIQGILSSRIDKLDNKSKLLLRVASVIGKNFNQDILERTIVSDPELKEDIHTFLDEGLAALINKDLLKITVKKNEIEYEFKNTMAYEVVYNSIVEEMLGDIHKLVGESIEYLYEERVDDYYEILAHHFELGHHLEKNFHYVELSADKLADKYVNNEALNYYNKALNIINTSANEFSLDRIAIKRKTVDLNHKIGKIYFITGVWDKGISVDEKALNTSQEMRDKLLTSKSLQNLAKFYKAIGKYDNALKLLNDAMQIVHDINDKTQASEIQREIGSIYYFLGDTNKALEWIEDGLLAAKILHDEYLIAKYQNDRGMIYCKKEKFNEALDCFNSSIEYKKKVNDKFGIGISMGNIVDIYYSQGKFERALKYCKEALLVTKEISDSWGTAVNLHNIGNIYFQMGKLKEATGPIKESLKISNEIGWETGNILNNIYLNFFIHREKSQLKGTTLIKKDIDKATVLGNKEIIARGKYFLGLLYNMLKDKKSKNLSNQCFDEALELATSIHASDLVDNIKRIRKSEKNKKS